MNQKSRILISLLLVFCFNCKNNKEVDDKTVNTNLIEKQEKPNKFVFEIDFKTSKPDNFKLFANDVFLNNNQFLNLAVTHKLNSNETKKKIKFELPEGIIPDYSVGLVLGDKVEKTVQVNTIKIYTNKAEFLISSNVLHNYFTFNKFIDYDAEHGVLKTKGLDGKYNPTMFLRKKIIDKLY